MRNNSQCGCHPSLGPAKWTAQGAESRRGRRKSLCATASAGCRGTVALPAGLDYHEAPWPSQLASCDYGLQRVLVDVGGEDQERQDVAPLVAFLRRQRLWSGGDRIELRVNYPEAIREAFRPGTLPITAEQLEDEAAVLWFFPQEWRVPLPLFEWRVEVRERLTNHLAILAREQPELGFDAPGQSC